MAKMYEGFSWEETPDDPCCSEVEPGDYLGSHYHCYYCGETCSVMGHNDCLEKAKESNGR